MPDDRPALPQAPSPAPAGGGRPPLPRPVLVPERSDFLAEDGPVAEKVEAFLAKALAACAGPERAARALVPWVCDVLLSRHSLKAYGRDLVDFVRHMEAQ